METEARKFALFFSLAGPQAIEVFNMFEFEAPVEVNTTKSSKGSKQNREQNQCVCWKRMT